MAEIKIMFKNCGPEKTDERDKELEQVKEDMEELKKERIEAAKRKQSEKMKVLSKDKMAKMKDVKKKPPGAKAGGDWVVHRGIFQQLLFSCQNWVKWRIYFVDAFAEEQIGGYWLPPDWGYWFQCSKGLKKVQDAKRE